MKVGLFVEGHTDKEVISILVKKIDPKIKIIARVVPPGDLLSPQKIRPYIEQDLLPKHHDLTKVIICKDSECTDPKEFCRVEEEFKKEFQGFKIPVQICIVVHALEGWLMADAESLSKFLGDARIKIPKNSESLCKPKEALMELFRKANRDYIPKREKIAEMADIERIAKNNKSFARFRKLLK
jgi:hypothetical protein